MRSWPHVLVRCYASYVVWKFKARPPLSILRERIEISEMQAFKSLVRTCSLFSNRGYYILSQSLCADSYIFIASGFLPRVRHQSNSRWEGTECCVSDSLLS